MYESKGYRDRVLLPKGSLTSWKETCLVDTQVLHYTAQGADRFAGILDAIIIIITAGITTTIMQITSWDVNYFLMFTLNRVSWRNDFSPSCSALVCYLPCSISALRDWVSWFCFLSLCFAIPFSPSLFTSEICSPCWAPHTSLLNHLIFLIPNLGLFLANCWQ